jgi:hypothetical protein
MSTSSDKSNRSNFFSDGLSAGAVQKEFIEAPLAAARQPAITTGLDLLAFMSAMPAVFLASEQRELKRLSRTSDDKNDPRIERLKTSIERASELSSTAKLGKTRIDRAIVAMSTDENVFHGFVSDTNLKPREKLTIRISAMRDGTATKDEKSLSAITDADGYFSISLGKEKADTRQTYESTVKLSEQMAERLASVNAKTTLETAKPRSASATANTNEVLARVEILDSNKNIIYQDDSPLVVNTGTAYREYVVTDDPNVKPQTSNTKTTPNAANTKTSSEKPAQARHADAEKTNASLQKASLDTKKTTVGRTRK